MSASVKLITFSSVLDRLVSLVVIDLFLISLALFLFLPLNAFFVCSAFLSLSLFLYVCCSWKRVNAPVKLCSAFLRICAMSFLNSLSGVICTLTL